MKKIFILIPILIMGCAKPETPAQSIYLVESDYAAALRVELAYSGLPRCGKPNSPILCSDVNIIKKVQKSDDIAWFAIQDAQSAVRTQGYGNSATVTIVASATALTKAFSDITATLGVK